jgi:hypothetical protein
MTFYYKEALRMQYEARNTLLGEWLAIQNEPQQWHDQIKEQNTIVLKLGRKRNNKWWARRTKTRTAWSN